MYNTQQITVDPIFFFFQIQNVQSPVHSVVPIHTLVPKTNQVHRQKL